MDLGVIEAVVNTKHNTLLAALKVILIVLAVCFLLLGIVLFWPLLVPAAGCAVGAYFADLNAVVDYEYSLVDNELRIAKILKKERRKFLGTFDLSHLEILAPETSGSIRSYKELTKYKTWDCSDHGEDASNRFHAYIDGKERVILTIDSEEGQTLLRNIQHFAPRKVELHS